MSMSQADSINTTSRRRFLAKGAATVAGAAILATPVSAHVATGPDPIFAAIDAHQTARAVVYAAVDAVSAAEKDLTGRGLRPSQERGKCPSLDECEATLSEAFDAETNAACAILNTPPTTMAGVLALLQYANATDIDGMGWPVELETEDGKTRSWHYFLIEALAATLPSMVSA
jgi:hypothetical protein